LSNCDRLALEFLVDLFGGHFRVAAKLVGTRRHPIGIWNISGDSATKAAKAMLPYSILKKEQLTLFLEGRATVKGRGRPLLAPVVKQRKKIAQRIRFFEKAAMARGRVMSVEALVVAAIVDDGAPALRKLYQAGVSAEDFVSFEDEFQWVAEKLAAKQPMNVRTFRISFLTSSGWCRASGFKTFCKN